MNADLCSMIEYKVNSTQQIIQADKSEVICEPVISVKLSISTSHETILISEFRWRHVFQFVAHQPYPTGIVFNGKFDRQCSWKQEHFEYD